MKIMIGKMFKWGEPPECYALFIEGLGLLECILDQEDKPFACILLNGKKLLKLKKLIEKELNMKSKKVNPSNKREEKNAKKSFSKTEKTVKPVAKDTNKTRRKMKKPTKGQIK